MKPEGGGAGAGGINQRGWREPLLEDPRGDEGERRYEGRGTGGGCGGEQ